MNGDVLLTAIYDLIVVSFELLIFTRMFSLRRKGFFYKAIMYLGSAVMIAGYMIVTYVYHWAAAIASIFLLMFPSLALFFVLARHRDARFFLTFCFVDSVTTVLCFIGRYCGVLWPPMGIRISMTVTFLLFLAVFLLGRDYFKRYQKLQELVKSGWGSMAICSGLIYFTQVFLAVHPMPLGGRLDYAPTYLIFSVTILSCYAVFIGSMFRMRKIYEQNKRLDYEKHIFEIAYKDALTGLYNRAAYMEESSNLEEDREGNLPICCMMLDLNNFKIINDTIGHHNGDEALKRAANALREVFSGKNHHIYRMGGDEFAVIMTKSCREEARERVAFLNQRMKLTGCEEHFPLCLAAGYDFVENETDSIEAALMRADKNMYGDKLQKKLAEKSREERRMV